MFMFGLSQRGLYDMKAALDKPMAFDEAEQVVLLVAHAYRRVNDPLVKARLGNLLTQAQRRRREAGNALPR